MRVPFAFFADRTRKAVGCRTGRPALTAPCAVTGIMQARLHPRNVPMPLRRPTFALAAALLLATSTAAGQGTPPAAAAKPFTAVELGRFDEPWAMAFLPDGRLLITEKRGALKLFDPATRRSGTVTGVPAVAYGGQGGLGDVAVHPHYTDNGLIYLSYAEAGPGDTRGAAVARARLVTDAQGGGKLDGLQVIWRQVPKTSGHGHYGHRLLFGPDGKLWISSSERQKFDPAQDMAGNLGKILRLDDDGGVPPDNPFAARGGVAAQVWSLGHRNVLGMAFDAAGRLWEVEMGPRGGDELNRVERGANYGWPVVSDGDHYSGMPIPDHATRPEFAAPKISWTPVISPSSLAIYSGRRYPGWTGNGFIGGLSSKALVRVEFAGDGAREAARYDMGQRIRAVEQAPDGLLWLLEDGKDARLLELVPNGGKAG